jgi:tRNA threonylcarbamoyladenosine modification (KEOPS) complex  Pcc1 subunit
MRFYNIPIKYERSVVLAVEANSLREAVHKAINEIAVIDNKADRGTIGIDINIDEININISDEDLAYIKELNIY